MWHVIKAELRQWLGLQIMTFIAGLSLVVAAWSIERETGTAGGRPLDFRELRVVFVWLYFCAAPVLVGWHWNLHKNKASTFLIVDALPFSGVALNLMRLLSLTLQLVPVLVVWSLHYVMMNSNGRPFTPWLSVGVFFFLLFWAAATLCHRLLWVMMWILVALLAFTNTLFKIDSLSFVPLDFSAVWTAVVFALLTLGTGWWLVKKYPQGS